MHLPKIQRRNYNCVIFWITTHNLWNGTKLLKSGLFHRLRSGNFRGEKKTCFLKCVINENNCVVFLITTQYLWKGIRRRINALKSSMKYWLRSGFMKGKTKKSGFWRTTAFSRGFQKYMGWPVSACISGVLG